MINELIPFFCAIFLLGGSAWMYFLIDRFKHHLNFLGAFILLLIGMGFLIFIICCFIFLLDALCPKCYKYAPKFVWSYGYTGGHKHLCEKCDPNRIKEVYGNNLKYLEQLYQEKQCQK